MKFYHISQRDTKCVDFLLADGKNLMEDLQMLLMILAVIWDDLKNCRWPCSGLLMYNSISVLLPNAQVVQVRFFYCCPHWFSHYYSILLIHLSVVQPFSVLIFIFTGVRFGLVLAFWFVLWGFPARFLFVSSNSHIAVPLPSQTERPGFIESLLFLKTSPRSVKCTATLI